jgi:hypothetical protein
MALIKYKGYNLPIREDLVHAHERCWNRLSEAGTWFDGNQRVNIAAEVRNARECRFCVEQKEAVSPNSVSGSHSNLGMLNDNEVEIIHRTVSDPARLSKKWFKGIISKGVKEEEYIEMIGIIAMVMVIDTFTFAIGVNDHSLPKPKPGKPSYYRPPGAKTKAAWVPIVEPEDAVKSDGDLYPNPKVGYILRSLSAVPETKIHYWDLMHSHYLPEPIIYQFDRDFRAISRPQMELVAGRVSALHQCLF